MKLLKELESNYKKSIYSRCTKIKDNHNLMKNFKNKVAAITGAGSGIGQQLALLLAKSFWWLNRAAFSLADTGSLIIRCLMCFWPFFYRFQVVSSPLTRFYVAPARK